MTKTQVYLPDDELRELHRLARQRKRAVAELVREAVRRVWLRPVGTGPVGLWDGPFGGSSADHDAAFDEL
ncbi:MAG: CopG family transcriptional regulator [Myxococcales bacterium]|nr:CopG family transcriptional regulator [Myxococcales bacterium]